MILFFKNLLFTLLVPGTVAVFVPLQIISGPWTGNLWYLTVGLLFMLLGTTIYIKCVWDFMCIGKGTPAPIDAPRALVIKGLYCYSRNPMYVGVLCIIFAWLVIYNDLNVLIYGILVFIFFQLLIMFYEEPKLQQLFGVEYVNYKKTVNRWLPVLWGNGGLAVQWKKNI